MENPGLTASIGLPTPQGKSQPQCDRDSVRRPLALSADAVAFVTDTVEYAVQVPLDRVNDLADALVVQVRRAGLRNLPIVRFRSRIENDRAGVTVSARW